MYDWLWLWVKIGDQESAPGKSHMSMKDGMIGGYIDPNDTNYGPNWFPQKDAAKVFLWLKVSDSYLSNIKANGWLESSGSIEDPETYRIRKKLIRFSDWPQSAQNKIRNATDKGKVVDLTGEYAQWAYSNDSTTNSMTWATSDVVKSIKDTTILNPPAIDKNSISSGDHNIGSGETYTSVTAFYADLTNLTGDITGILTSSVTDTSSCNLVITRGSFTFKITADTDHLGDPTAGYTITCSGVDHHFQWSGNSTGDIIFEKFILKRTVSAAAYIYFYITGGVTACTAYIRNILMDGNGGNNGYGVYVNSVPVQTFVYNCKIWDQDKNGILLGANTNSTSAYENLTIYNSGKGFDCGNIGYTNFTCRNITSHGNATNDWVTYGVGTGNNCATGSGSAIGFGTESGTVNNIVDSDFTSVTDTDANFLDIDATSDLYNAGSDGSYATTSINEVVRTSGEWDIGAFEYSITTMSGTITLPPITLTAALSDTGTINLSGTISLGGVVYQANTLYLDTPIEGAVTLQEVLQKLLAMLDGKMVEDTTTRQVTIYDRTGTSPKIKVQLNAADTSRDRLL